MARNDDQQRGSDTPSRVYRSSDVHKRRVDRKGREKKSAKPVASPATGEEIPVSEQPEAETKPAVVISPEFGKRSDAQRQADERWFAAMRENDLSDPAPNAAVRDTAAIPKVEASPASDDSNTGEEPAPSAPVSDEAPASDAVVDAPPSKAAAQTGAIPPASNAENPDAAPVADDDEGAEAPPASEKPSALRRLLDHLPKKRSLRIVAIVVPIILIVAIVAALLFAWNRWYRFDDHADIQGTWYAAGTEVSIEIGETSITLTDDVTYQYEIDAHDKTIHFTFGPMEGQGRYWLSDDRQYLVITDGSDFDGTSTALDDALHSLSDMGDRVTGADVKLPEGEGVIAFSRLPYRGTFSEIVSRAVAEKKAEEEARKEAERKAAEEAAEAASYDYYYYEEEYAEEESASEEPASGEESQEEPAAEEYDGGEG